MFVDPTFMNVTPVGDCQPRSFTVGAPLGCEVSEDPSKIGVLSGPWKVCWTCVAMWTHITLNYEIWNESTCIDLGFSPYLICSVMFLGHSVWYFFITQRMWHSHDPLLLAPSLVSSSFWHDHMIWNCQPCQANRCRLLCVQSLKGDCHEHWEVAWSQGRSRLKASFLICWSI